MKIRRIAAGDLDDLTEMVVEFERFLDHIEGKRRRHDVKAMRAKLKAGGFGKRRFFEGIVAVGDGKPQGYLLYHLGFSTNFHCGTLFVSDLFVREKARRQGVGEALMRRATALARARGCGRVEWTVWNINAAAIGFYMSLGSKPIDDELILGIQLAK